LGCARLLDLCQIDRTLQAQGPFGHDQDDLIKNLAADLGQVKNIDIRRAMVSHFYQADKDYGTRLAAAVAVDVKDVQTTIGH